MRSASSGMLPSLTGVLLSVLAVMALSLVASLDLALVASAQDEQLSFDLRDAGLGHSALCPNLDSRLVQLAEASDPEAFALQAGLDYDRALTRLVLEMAEGSALPDGYDLQVEATYANLIQAWAPISPLCSLSAEPNVLSVRPPFRPTLNIPQAPYDPSVAGSR